MNDNIFYIGMDFGSFKTSVTASNGYRETFQTAVGWPKDHVARAMLGRDVIFGEEVLQQRLALNVVRPFAKGALKYVAGSEFGVSEDQLEMHREAARLLVAHAVQSMSPPPEVPVYGVIGAPSRASIENKQVLMDAVRGTLDAVVIVAEPFSVAYSMNRLKDTLVVDIGAGTTDICPMYGTYPKEEDQVTISIGGDTVDEEFYKRLKTKYPDAQLSLNMARAIKEKYGFVHNVNEEAIVMLPVDGRPTQFDVTEPLKAACRALVEPIVSGLRDVIARFDPEFQRPLLQNILLGGGGSRLNGLDQLVEESLEPFGGGSVTKVDDCVFAGAVGALKLAQGMPRQYWEQLCERCDTAKVA
jgi:rod shape-determining protein MreB